MPWKSQPFKSVAENIFIQWRLLSFCSMPKRYFQWPHQTPTEWLILHICSNQEERRRCKTPVQMINIQSLMASVSKSQVVDITPVWYLSITRKRLMKCINRIVTLLLGWSFTSLFSTNTAISEMMWSCYNSSCVPYVGPQASSSCNRTVPWRTGHLWQSTFFTPNFVRCWSILNNSFQANSSANL